MPKHATWLSRGLLAAVVLLVARYDLWAVRAATGEPFAWGRTDLFGYYNLLARGFVQGQLSLPVEPSPQLLALPNPWDPAVDPALKMHDVALFNGRYYLYYGVTPAVLLFAPWRLLTGTDLPQNFAVFLFAFTGYLLALGALLGVTAMAGVRPGAGLTVLLAIGPGVCQGIPFLLNRVDVYEVAIACGYCCISAALYCLVRAFMKANPLPWLAAAGVCFALAVGSRPHLLFPGLIAGFALPWLRPRRALGAYWAGYTAIGLGIAGYNYARFGNALEFGLRYHLGGPGQNRIELAAQNWLPGIYYLLLAPPEFTPVFPWMRLLFRFPFDNAKAYPLPPDYFIEPTAGALWLAPFLLAALLLPFSRAAGRARPVLLIAAAGGLAVLLFLLSNHFVTQRYVVDFLPLLVWASLALLGVKAAGHRVVHLGLAMGIAWSAVANLALGIGGPYFDTLKNRPKNYVRLAAWLSPTDEARPRINPKIDVRFRATFTPRRPGYREPLLTVGHSHYAYYLYIDRPDDRMHFYSQYGDQRLELDLGYPGPDPHEITFTYDPGQQRATVTIDGQPAFTQTIPLLVTAPAGITFGSNLSDPGVSYSRFPGTVQVLQRSVTPSGQAPR